MKASLCILTAKEKGFSTQIQTSFRTIYNTHHNAVRDHTQIDLREGVTHTAIISDRVIFKKMYKDPFRPVIVAELEARGITPTFEEIQNYNKLISLLKFSEGNKKSFQPVTPFEHFQWW